MVAGSRELGQDDYLRPRNKRLADRRVTVKPDPKAKEWVAEKGCDPVFGTRPLKRFLQRNLETKLARAFIAGEVNEGTAITFTVQNDELVRVHEAHVAEK